MWKLTFFTLDAKGMFLHKRKKIVGKANSIRQVENRYKQCKTPVSVFCNKITFPCVFTSKFVSYFDFLYKVLLFLVEKLDLKKRRYDIKAKLRMKVLGLPFDSNLKIIDDGFRSKNFDPGRANFCGSGLPFMVWVWIGKISPKNVKFFNFFPFGSKKSLRVGS